MDEKKRAHQQEKSIPSRPLISGGTILVVALLLYVFWWAPARQTTVERTQQEMVDWRTQYEQQRGILENLTLAYNAILANASISDAQRRTTLDELVTRY